MLGERVQRMPALAADVARAGHEIGNHAWSHTSFRSLWQSQIIAEIDRTQGEIIRATGVHPVLLRPPYGRYPPSALPLIAERDLDIILWSIDSRDWELSDPHELAASVVRALKPGAIILMHDRTPLAAKALEEIIVRGRERGFAFVTVGELAGLVSPLALVRIARAASEGDRSSRGVPQPLQL
jgi:peptidoglycan/xylan/chitin deacetylase (PgdA/CDA1 family)